MDEIINKIFKYCSVCSYCGSIWIQESGLCQDCYDLLTERYVYEPTDPLATAFYYYLWNPNISNLLSNHLHALKGWQVAFKWKHYAYLMSLRYRSYLPTGRAIKVVYPPSTTGKKDHAYCFAFYTAYYLGGELVSLKRDRTEVNRSQKKKTVSERYEIEFRRDEKFSVNSENIEQDVWLFVDDVLTTGATYLAVKKALGNPKFMYTWVLAKRTL